MHYSMGYIGVLERSSLDSQVGYLRVVPALHFNHHHFLFLFCLLWLLRVTAGGLCWRWTNSNRCHMQIPLPSPPLHFPTLSYNLCIIMQLSSALNRCFQLVYPKIEQVICGKQTGKSLGPRRVSGRVQHTYVSISYVSVFQSNLDHNQSSIIP